MKILFNANIVTESRTFFGYVAFQGPYIIAVGEGDPDGQLLATADAINVRRAMVMPGVIDEHVHLREPGMTRKGNFASETIAAVAGGVTSVMDMPNVSPPTTTVERIYDKVERAKAVALTNFSFYLGATDDNIAEIDRADFSKICGVKAFLGSSTGGMLLSQQSVERLFSRMAERDVLVAAHCEDEAVIRANTAKYTAMYGADLPVRFHTMIRSSQACWRSAHNAVLLARRLNTRLHVLHVSTRHELQLFDYTVPLAEKRITAEVCLPHLLFCSRDYLKKGVRIKCNPSVKGSSDVMALRHALQSSRIDTVATDHAPHLLAEKQGGALKAASGMPTIQFSLPVMLELARIGVLSVNDVVRKMCFAPATLYRIDRRGMLKEGCFADIVVVNTDEQGYKVTDNDVLSLCKWTPLSGITLHHRVAMTFVNGNLVYDNGKVYDHFKGKPLKFNR